MSISLTQWLLKKPLHSFAEEIAFFPLVTLGNLCDEAHFCVNP